MRNWAGNVTYTTERVLAPCSVDEAAELIARERRVRPLGTRHSFSRVADTSGLLLSTENLDRVVEIAKRTVTVEAGIRYGELGSVLAGSGLALQNYASLPHISVGGAVATATHGSGARNRSLASSVAALELATAGGDLVRLERGMRDFDGAVVSLGRLGLVVRITLDVVPAFELRQHVFDLLPWADTEAHLDELLALGYSTSLFTLWTDAGVDQVWVKAREPVDGCFGASPADGPRHPIPGLDTVNCTEQLGVPGPSGDRLPHFRQGFTPSGGDELQSEYAVPRERAVEAMRALRALGADLTPLLLTSEIRAVAADAFWLSPFYERDAVCLHFTWKPLEREVHAMLERIEGVLGPFEPRPHWGKLHLAPVRYPRAADFEELRERLDPEGVFQLNARPV